MFDIEELINNGGLFDGHYLLIRPLSVDGATADVWLALDTHTVSEEDKDRLRDVPHMADDDIERLGLIVAIKIYRPQNALDMEGEQRFRDEYMIVFNCHHTNLIHPTQYSIYKGIPYLVLPYCKLGSSERLVGQKLSDDILWKYIFDVASGLAYLHALNPPIVHQDIKPANILLDDTHHFAITDFGISSQKGGVHYYYSDEENSGTLAYMAPERFVEDADHIPQSDIWAFGATLFEILTGKMPFGEEGGKAQAETNAAVPAVKGLSVDLQRLVNACLDKEPGNRPSAVQLVAAARARQYPVKTKRTLPLIAFIVTLAAVVAVGAALLLSNGRRMSDGRTAGNDSAEVLKQGARRFNANNIADVRQELMNQNEARKGLQDLKRLAGKGNVDARFTLSRLYAVSAGTLTVSDDVAKMQACLKGVVGQDGATAHKMLEDIVGDCPDYYPALYELACDHLKAERMGGGEPNPKRAKKLLEKAHKYAVNANDAAYINKITELLNIL